MPGRSFASRIVLALAGMAAVGSSHAFCINVPDPDTAEVSQRHEMKVEVVGDAEMGYNVERLAVRLARP